MNNDITFEIKKHIGVIAEYATGWKKEINLVAWNGGAPKFDVRDWDPAHEHMSRGVTLTEKEINKLIDSVKEKAPEIKDVMSKANKKARTEVDKER